MVHNTVSTHTFSLTNSLSLSHKLSYKRKFVRETLNDAPKQNLPIEKRSTKIYCVDGFALQGYSDSDNLKKYFNQNRGVTINGNKLVPVVPAIQFCFSDPIDSSALEPNVIAGLKLCIERKENTQGLLGTQVDEFIKNSRLSTEDPSNNLSHAYFYKNRIEGVVTVPIDEGGDEDLLLHALDMVVRKYGKDCKQMQLKLLEASWTHCPYLYLDKKKIKLSMVDADCVGWRKCSRCQMMNGFWMEGEDGLNGANCGCCSASLDDVLIEKEIPKTNVTHVYPNSDRNEPMGAFQLDEMGSMNYLDGANIEGNLKNRALEHDARIMRSMISRNYAPVIMIDQGMSTEQKNTLKKEFTQYTLVEHKGIPNVHAKIANERKCIFRLFNDILANKQLIVDIGGARLGVCGENYRCMQPVLTWRDVERAYFKTLTNKDCNHTLQNCDCDAGKRPSLMAIDSLYDIDPLSLVKYMKLANSDTLYYCLSTAAVDFSEQKGDLFDDQGKWFFVDDKLLTVFNGDNLPYENDMRLSDLWSTADTIIVGDKCINISTMRTVGNHIIRMAKLLDLKNNNLGYDKVSSVCSFVNEIDIPIIDAESWLSELEYPPLKTRTIKIDTKLLRTLLIRNMTNLLSFDDMLKYAIGIAHSKYQIKDKNVSNTNVTADMAMNHALIATVLSRRNAKLVNKVLKQSRLVSKPYNSWMTMNRQDLISLGLTLTSGLINEVENTITHTGYGNIIAKYYEKVINEWVNTVKWDNLLNMLTHYKLRDVKIVNYKGAVQQVTNYSLCDHHCHDCAHAVVHSNKYCECCRYIKIQDAESVCECCNVNKCLHKCNHVCLNKIEHDTSEEGDLKFCDCCGVFYKGYICGVCRLVNCKTFINIPTIQAPKLNEDEKATKIKQKKEKTIKRNYEIPVEVKNRINDINTSNIKDNTGWSSNEPGPNIDEMHASSMRMKPETEEKGKEVSVEHLASVTSLEYATMFTDKQEYMLLEPSDPYPLAVAGWSELKYVGMGFTFVHRSDIQVENEEVMSGVGLLCGQNSLEAILGKVDVDLLQSIAEQTNNYSDVDLSTYLTHQNVNHCILMEKYMLVNRVDATNNNFACIIHDSWHGLKVKHWNICNIKQLSCKSFIPLYHPWMSENDLKVDEVFKELTNDVRQLKEPDRLYCCYKIYKNYLTSETKYGTLYCKPKLVSKDGITYLTNNEQGIHEVKSYLLTFPVEGEILSHLQQVVNCSNDILSSKLFTFPYDSKIPTNEQEYNDYMQQKTLARIRNIAKLMLVYNNQEDISMFGDRALVKPIRVNNGHYLEKTGKLTKLKSGDMCLINTGTKTTVMFVQTSKHGIHLPKQLNLKKNQSVEVQLLKLSLTSEIITLYSITLGYANWQDIRKLVANATTVVGPAGTGKTHRLVADHNTNSTVCVKTFGARQEIISRLQSKDKVVSAERASLEKITSEVLQIDEAGMLELFDLAIMLTNNVKTLKLYGDNDQVGTIDTDTQFGERELCSILQLKKNVEVLKESYRFGESLCKVMRNLGYNVVSKTEHDTEIKLLDEPTLSFTTIKQLVKQHKIDVVLVFYQKTKSMLLAQKLSVDVHTVHEYQARSANNVLVVQHNPTMRSGGIWQDKKYCVSAMTRCKKKLIWLSIGMAMGKSLEARAGPTTVIIEKTTKVLKKTFSKPNTQPQKGTVKWVQDVEGGPMRMVRIEPKENTGKVDPNEEETDPNPLTWEEYLQTHPLITGTWGDHVSDDEEDINAQDTVPPTQGGGLYGDEVDAYQDWTCLGLPSKVIDRFLIGINKNNIITYSAGGKTGIWKSSQGNLKMLGMRFDNNILLVSQGEGTMDYLRDSLKEGKLEDLIQNENAHVENEYFNLLNENAQLWWNEKSKVIINLIEAFHVNINYMFKQYKKNKLILLQNTNVESIIKNVNETMPNYKVVDVQKNQFKIVIGLGIKVTVELQERNKIYIGNKSAFTALIKHGWEKHNKEIINWCQEKLDKYIEDKDATRAINELTNFVQANKEIKKQTTSILTEAVGKLVPSYGGQTWSVNVEDSIMLTVYGMENGVIFPKYINVSKLGEIICEIFRTTGLHGKVVRQNKWLNIVMARDAIIIIDMSITPLGDAIVVNEGVLKDKVISMLKAKCYNEWMDWKESNKFTNEILERVQSTCVIVQERVQNLHSTEYLTLQFVDALGSMDDIIEEMLRFDFIDKPRQVKEEYSTHVPDPKLHKVRKSASCCAQVSINPENFSKEDWDFAPCYNVNLFYDRMVAIALRIQHWKIGGSEFNIKFVDGVVSLSTFGGCAICCGFKVKWNDQLIMVVDSANWKTIQRRCYILKSVKFFQYDLYIQLIMLFPCFWKMVEASENNVSFNILEAAFVSNWKKDKHMRKAATYDRIYAGYKYLKTKCTNMISGESYAVYEAENLEYMQRCKDKLGSLFHMSNKVLEKKCMRLWPSPIVFYTDKNKPFKVCLTSEGWFTNDPVVAVNKQMHLLPTQQLLNMTLKVRLQSRGYSFAKSFTSHESIPMGYDQALNFSLEHHRTNNTKVNAIINDRTESMLAPQLKKLQDILWLSTNQKNRYGNILNADLPHLTINHHGTWISNEGYDSLIELIAIQLHYSMLPAGRRSIYIGNFPESVLCVSAWGMKAFPVKKMNNIYSLGLASCEIIMKKLHEIYKAAVTRTATDESYKLSEIDDMMLASTTEHATKGTSKWFAVTDEESNEIKSTYAHIGLHNLSVSVEELLDTLEKKEIKVCTLMLPSMELENIFPFKIVQENNEMYAMYEHSAWPIKINQELYSTLMYKTSMTSGSNWYSIHQEGCVLGHIKIRCTKMPNYIPKPTYMHKIDKFNGNNKVVFEIPLPKFSQTLEQGLVTKQIEIDDKLYRQLTLRMKMPKCTLQDLLPYARTYIQTTMYTQLGFNDRLASLANYAQEACACVYYQETINNGALYDTLCKTESIWSDDASGSISDKLKNALWVKLSQFWELFGVEEKVVDWVKQEASKILPTVFYNYLSKLKALSIKEHTHDFNIIKFKENKETKPTTPQNTPPNPPHDEHQDKFDKPEVVFDNNPIYDVLEEHKPTSEDIKREIDEPEQEDLKTSNNTSCDQVDNDWSDELIENVVDSILKAVKEEVAKQIEADSVDVVVPLPLVAVSDQLALDSTKFEGHNFNFSQSVKYDVETKTAFSPQSSGDCVLKCFERFLSTIPEKRDLNLALFMQRDWLNELDCQALAFMNALNICIVYKRKAVLTNFCDLWETIYLEHTVKKHIHHAVLIEPLRMEKVEINNPTCKTPKTLITKLDKQLERMNWDMSATELLKVMVKCLKNDKEALIQLANYNNDGNIFELTAVLNMQNAVRASLRKMYPILPCQIQCGNNIYCANVDTTNICTGDMLGLVTTKGCYVSFVVDAVPDKLLAVTLCEENTQAANFIIHLPHKWSSMHIKKKTISYIMRPKGLGTCLNNITKRLIDNSCLEMTNTSVGEIGCEWLYIGHYDNRPHHKYDDLNILQQYSTSKWVVMCEGVDETVINELLSRQDVVRTAIHNGTLVKLLEYYEVKVCLLHCFWLRELKISHTRNNNELIIDYKDYKKHECLWKAMLEKSTETVNLKICRKKQLLTTKYISTLEELSELIMCDVDNSIKYVSKLLPCHVQLLDMPAGLEIKLKEFMTSNIIRLTSKKWLVTGSLMVIMFHKTTRGGGWDTNGEHEMKGDDYSRWWGGPNFVPDVEKLENIKGKIGEMSVEALHTQGVYDYSSDQMNLSDSIKMELAWADEIVWDQNVLIGDEISEITPYEIIDMWDVNDITSYNTKYAPLIDMKIRTRTVVCGTMESIKTTLTKYPSFSRPVYTKIANSEFNAVTGRLGHKVNYRTKVLDPKFEAYNICEVFFNKNWKIQSATFKENTLSYNTEATVQWLSERPDASKVADELKQILSEGLNMHQLNKLNVHLKLESLLKDEPSTDHRQTKARILVWQAKGLCSIFSPIFKEVKQRLKSCLNLKALYSDGLTPLQISERLTQVSHAKYIIENDMQQQDRQTDKTLLDIEMEMYIILGVHPDVVGLWRCSHDNWYFKGRSVSGKNDGMRLTGQATTALGNAITNLAVHWRICKDLGNDMKMFCFLGDDGIILTDRALKVADMKSYGKNYCNMILKPKVSEHSGTFCCFTVYRTRNNQITIGADPIRLKRRFEVTNGVGAINETNMNARSMSYCMMLGDLQIVRQLINVKKWPIKPVAWYNAAECFSSCDLKHGEYLGCAEDHLVSLISMMRECDYHNHRLLHWVESV